MDKVEVRRWRDVRRSAVQRGQVDPARVALLRQEQLSEVRAHRLADIRKALDYKQQDVADAMHVGQPRISQIERGDLANSELGTIRGYVEALGGTLHVVAEFGDQTLTLE